EEKYRELQGTYPVISLSFANVKKETYTEMKHRICQILSDAYNGNRFLEEKSILSDSEKEYFDCVSRNIPGTDMSISLHKLCDFMQRCYGKKVIIILDEYDAPMQEAYVRGYWEEAVSFMRDLFNSTFKTNPYLERAVMTGITRVSRESVFSDLNNLEIITTTSDKYADVYGFTQTEVSNALCEFGLSSFENEVGEWYDGFVFGGKTNIYNPWSILNFLNKKKFDTYWANTSSNSMVSKLIREGSREVKRMMEELLRGGILHTQIDEQVVFNQLDYSESAIWSLLLAGGYLKAQKYVMNMETGKKEYDLSLTNREVKYMFQNMVGEWFQACVPAYNDFVKALLLDDLDAMNEYMNQVALASFSSFDVGREASKQVEPERFYHGFVLGLMVELTGRYLVTSNRESGFGRYDVMLEPLRDRNGALYGDAMILEFKVHRPKKEKDLKETVQTALAQIEEKNYAVVLSERGIPKERIRTYGFAFKGKKVLIGKGQA
ncbi:MAG: ATP-binding protein, partial [Lachnospiraceae bacterium]|nr:ATP-binding protein [Lachnospiraceae bacterium]